MKAEFILTIIVLIAYIVKTLLNIAGTALLLSKDKALLQQTDKLEKEYLLIKGLY